MDVWALMENGAKPVHFLGPLVCTHPPRLPGNNSAFQLIDGQQRITTLTILLAAIRDVARSRNLVDFAEEVTEDYLLFKRRTGNERYKVLPRLGDREVLTAMIEGHDLSPFTNSRVFEAWKYFHRHVQHLARKDTRKQLTKLLDVIASRLNLVAVLIDGENPYEIFESLNSTGLPLKESDLIRNFVFMAIPLDKQQGFNEQHWKAFEEMFDATETERAVEMTAFYRDYLMRNGRYSKEDATFVDFKSTHEEAIKTPEALVLELKRFARLDLMLRRPRSVKDKELRRALRQVEGMDITTAYPLLLNLLDQFDGGQLSKEDLCGCLRDLVSFVLRRSICGETTRTYGKWFVEAITLVRNSPRADLQACWLGRRWPDDAAVAERLASFELYRRESIKTRVILEALEESFGHRERVDLSTLTIEHVMPQTITNNQNGRAWKEMLGTDWEKQQARLLHTLGNLTLTGYNTELSNSPFATKQVELTKSHLDLNLHFKGLAKWDAAAIEARRVILTEKVLGEWPRPTSKIAYEASSEAMTEPEGLSNGAKQRLEYWRHLDTRLEERGMPRELIVPAPDSSISIPVGISGTMELTLSLNNQRGGIYVSLMMTGKVGEKIGRVLEQEKAALHAGLGYDARWELNSSGGEIFVADEGIPIRDPNDWPVQHDWFGDRLEDFQRVLVPRVVAAEEIVLKDPAVRQSVDQQNRLKEYWAACGRTLAGSPTTFREYDPAYGRRYCRFQSIDTGIWFGAQYYADEGKVCVYFAAGNTADRKIRTAAKNLAETQLAALSTEFGAGIVWDEPYFSTTTGGKIEDRADWLRQHQWVRDMAGRFASTFKARLGLDE